MVARQLLVAALVPAVAMAFVGPVAPCSRPAAGRGVVRMMSEVTDKPKPVTSTYIPSSTPVTPIKTETSSSSALVPINKQNIEAGAAIVGTGVGVALFGPLFGIALGLLSNYVAKSESDIGEAARGVGKTALEIFNYIAKINTKYEIADKLGDATKTTIQKLKETDNEGPVSKLEETVSTTSSKVKELNQQYDLVGKARSAVQVAVDLSSAAFDKAVELNDKYALVEKTGEAVKTAAAKVKEAVDKTE